MGVIFGSISICLHVIAFLLIFYLLKQVRTLQTHEVNDIQQLFEKYLKEIKKENDRLQNELLTLSSEKHKQSLVAKRKHAPHQTAHVANLNKRSQGTSLTEKTDHISDTYEPSLQAKILQLYHQGHSEEDIAKTLNCGKTEVELIVKFHQPNE